MQSLNENRKCYIQRRGEGGRVLPSWCPMMTVKDLVINLKASLSCEKMGHKSQSGAGILALHTVIRLAPCQHFLFGALHFLSFQIRNPEPGLVLIWSVASSRFA